MQAALKMAHDHGDELVRIPGGYWTWRGCPFNGGVPQESFGTTTIEAIVTRGCLVYSEWKENARGKFPVAATAKRAAAVAAAE
jgi:hypothetical protein